MITREEIYNLETKLKNFYCTVQATENHEVENSQPLFDNRKLMKVSSGELGEIVEPNTSNQDNLQVRMKWPENKFINYSYPNMPIEVLRYIPKENPAQQNLFKI